MKNQIIKIVSGANAQINQVLFRDTLLNMLLMLVVIVALILPHLNPPSSKADAEPPGNLIVHIVWPKGNTDVDLWVDGPGELTPVGYSNKGGLLWNLLRDDLGSQPDATDMNYENAYTRGIVPGEYTINVHCYRCPVVPIDVAMEVSVNTGEPGKSSLKPLVNTVTKLVTEGQERTAIRFTLRDDGTIEPGSMHSVAKKLRSATKSGDGAMPYMPYGEGP